MNRRAAHILLIDDDPAVLDMVHSALAHYGMEVHAYPNAAEALDLMQNPSAPEFDLVITDINMEGLDGFDVIHKVKAMQPRLPGEPLHEAHRHPRDDPERLPPGGPAPGLPAGR